MIKVKYRIFLIILVLILLLLLVISCNSSDSSGHDGTYSTSGGVGGSNAENINAKLNKLLNAFGLLSYEQEAIGKLQKIVTNPDIGNTEGYKTYGSLEFYDLLKTLGALRVKGIIKNYLEFAKFQNNVERTINTVSDTDLKDRLQSKLKVCNSSYGFALKELFNDVVSAKLSYDDYVVQTTVKTNDQIAKLEPEIEGVVGDQDIFLHLDGAEGCAIAQIGEILVDSEIDHGRIYTYDEFYDLLNRLGFFRVIKIVDIYQKYEALQEADYNEIITMIKEEVKDETFKAALEDMAVMTYSSYRNNIRDIFTKYDDGKALSVIPEPEYVYEKMTHAVYRSLFTDIKEYTESIVRYKNIEGSLLREERQVLSYIQGKGGKSDFDFVVLLGKLDAAQVKAIVQFHAKILKAKSAAQEARMNVTDDREKEPLMEAFRDTVEEYHKHLVACFKHKDSQTFYNAIVTGTYANDFNRITEKASGLSPKTESGTTNPDINSDVKPGSTT
ncbi:hypothetical protein bcCo53_001246 (plasmid) [Borrelia coriaceae]|nr:hypothetical protein [Borrelia coriaceae]UPA17077.1 hypothetical protein bcCo53_001246 [Borrelia coriaceae]